MNILDLRSDTVTRPTLEMRLAMINSELGDDVYQEDPTVKLLEKRVAELFHKESALFFPSGTMSNLTAVLAWCPNRGSEVILGNNSHMFLFEQAGIAQFGGVSPRTVSNLPDGTMNIDTIRLSIRDYDIHEPATKLICIENTHNACGGKVLPFLFMSKLQTLSKTHNIPIHLDGARIWNAITAMETTPHEIAQYVDSLSVCLSKGLGAPIGSLLVGSEDLIVRARRIRKALGGGMRQTGVLAAAGLKAIDDFESGILSEDHRLAKSIENIIKNVSAFKMRSSVETNIIFFEIVLYDKTWEEENPGSVSSKVSEMFKERGLILSAWEPLVIRLVVHRDINHRFISQIAQCFREVSAELVKMKNN